MTITGTDFAMLSASRQMLVKRDEKAYKALLSALSALGTTYEIEQKVVQIVAGTMLAKHEPIAAPVRKRGSRGRGRGTPPR